MGEIRAMGEPRTYWPEEDDSGVIPKEITPEQRLALPACRPGWHAPDETGLECQICARPLTVEDEPIRVEVVPGAVESLMRVLAAGSRAISGGPRTDTTIDDLSVTAAVMARILHEQKVRKARRLGMPEEELRNLPGPEDDRT
jgi:hypothetical protein